CKTGFAGKGFEGIGRLAEGKPGQGHCGNCWCRRRSGCFGNLLSAKHGHPLSVRALPRRRADDPRFDSRADRSDLHPGCERASASPLRSAQGLCGDGKDPVGGDARHSNDRRSRVARLDGAVWHGLWAPKGTPKDVIAKLHAALVDTLADPAVRQRLTEVGQEIWPRDKQTPEALAAQQKAEIEKWWPIIKAAGIK